jgi:hypothetical protein
MATSDRFSSLALLLTILRKQSLSDRTGDRTALAPSSFSPTWHPQHAL